MENNEVPVVSMFTIPLLPPTAHILGCLPKFPRLDFKYFSIALFGS